MFVEELNSLKGMEILIISLRNTENQLQNDFKLIDTTKESQIKVDGRLVNLKKFVDFISDRFNKFAKVIKFVTIRIDNQE